MSDTSTNIDADIDYDEALNAPAPFKKSVRRGPFTTHNGPWFHYAKDGIFR